MSGQKALRDGVSLTRDNQKRIAGMDQSGVCPKCGYPLARDPPGRSCAACGFGSTVAIGPSAAALQAHVPHLPSHRFGDYELRRQIGLGGMGVVYEARQISLNRAVALKMILEDQARSSAGLRRFTIEAEAAAKLDHPNIVPIYEVGQYESHPYFSMKLILGESLKQKLARGDYGLPPTTPPRTKSAFQSRQRDAARLLATIARAVHHAHENGVVHRDLKPGNILIDLDGQPHLTDFGLAKMLSAPPEKKDEQTVTLPGTLMGTPAYMSPERACGQPADPASDIYSLGAVLYELLTGKPPFQGDSPCETFRKAMELEPVRLRAINPLLDRNLEIICLRCLEKDPHRRYASAALLADELERWLNGEPIRTRSGGFLRQRGRWIRNNLITTCLILSLFFGCLTGLVLVKMALGRQNKEIKRTQQVYQDWLREMYWKWANPDTKTITASSEILHIQFEGRHLKPPLNAWQFTLGVSTPTDPAVSCVLYAPWLCRIEEELKQALGQPVALNLKLLKTSPIPFWFSRDGDSHILRLDPVSYLQARRYSPDILPLVREEFRQEIVLFVAPRSAITNYDLWVAQPRTLCVPDVQTCFWATNLFARAGLPIQIVTHVGLTSPTRQDHLALLHGVLEGRWETGALPRNIFEEQRLRDCREIVSFLLPPNVFVARPDLDPAVRNAFQQALCTKATSSYLEESPGHVPPRLVPIQGKSFDPQPELLLGTTIHRQPD